MLPDDAARAADKVKTAHQVHAGAAEHEDARRGRQVELRWRRVRAPRWKSHLLPARPRGEAPPCPPPQEPRLTKKQRRKRGPHPHPPGGGGLLARAWTAPPP